MLRELQAVLRGKCTDTRNDRDSSSCRFDRGLDQLFSFLKSQRGELAGAAPGHQAMVADFDEMLNVLIQIRDVNGRLISGK